MRARVLGWIAFGVGVGAVTVQHRPHGSPPPAPLWGREPRRPLQTRSPGVGLIDSIQVTRPGPVETSVFRSPRIQAAQQHDPAPSCDAAPLALLRAGCPSAPPAVSACAEEGLECRYASADVCAELHECIHGWWTHVPADCLESEAGALLLSGASGCEERLPVADAPCAAEAVACGYLPCAIGGMPEVEAECRCGRWYLSWSRCPID